MNEDEQKIAEIYIDYDDVHLYGRDENGDIDHTDQLPWPSEWPATITRRVLRERGLADRIVN